MRQGRGGSTETENSAVFEKRKADHIQLSMDPRSQSGGSFFDYINLLPDALPEINLSQVSLRTEVAGREFSAPFFISSMTAGHAGSLSINEALSKLSHDKQILMGVGSQRKELFDPQAMEEWRTIRKKYPKVRWAGNIGLSQLIETSSVQLKAIEENLEAEVFFVHLNPLQEAIQKEGTPNFKGGLQAIEKAVKTFRCPVVVKEVGCGIATPTLQKLKGTGIRAVDVSGLGGTHWGRIETLRYEPNSIQYRTGLTFENWGLSTVECLLQAKELNLEYEIWASGGVRTGLDVAKLLALGAKFVGIAQPWLSACLAIPEDSGKHLDELFSQFSKELQIALFATGNRTPDELRRRQPWVWNKFLKASQD